MFSSRIGSRRLASYKYRYCFRPISRSRKRLVGGAFFRNMDSTIQPILAPSFSSGIPVDDVGFKPPPILNHEVTAEVTDTATSIDQWMEGRTPPLILNHDVTDTATSPYQQTGGSKKKKPRHSKQQKRDQKAMQPEGDTKKVIQLEGNDTIIQEKKNEGILQVPKTPVERILACARNAQFTRSVLIEPRLGLGPGFTPSRVHIITCSILPGYDAPSKPHDPRCMTTTIRIKPLLILDLNGILCHRSRRHKEPPGVTLGQFVGTCAGTPIIPRSDLVNMLMYLDRHFCLAVWTSAKRKTARGLLDLLIPPEICKKLLFLWTQAECDVLEQEKPVKEEEVVFQKLLSKVWRAFPLWNSCNTLLMDDSPDKCPYAVGNAIHPPRIHGQLCPPPPLPESSAAIDVWQSDAANQLIQSIFYERLVDHWATSPYERSVESTSLNIIEEQMQNLALRNFLQEHATGHMGWRGGDTTDLTTTTSEVLQVDQGGKDSVLQPSVVSTASSEGTKPKRPTDPRMSSK
jgi:hypothetical protein